MHVLSPAGPRYTGPVFDLSQSLEGLTESTQGIRSIDRIQKMDWRTIDLNLLVAFQAMLETRGVTRAGETLGLSQPAMSAALARLRELFGDPLFVRSGKEMEPTPRAVELADPVRRVLNSVATEVLQRSRFDPATSDKRFTIVTPDIGEVNFLPPLLARLARQAPLASVRTIARAAQAAAATLESGEAELALGHFPDLQRPGFFQQKLVDVPFVCLVRKGHPTIGAGMTVQDFLSASHAVVRPDGRGRDVDEWLTVGQTPRRVVVEVSHFMSLLPILESSDLIAAVPVDIAELCARYADLRIVQIPFTSPVIAVYQIWHQRFQKDPAHIWLRGVIYTMCNERLGDIGGTK